MVDERDTEIILSEEELKALGSGYLTVNRGTGWKTFRSGKTGTALESFHRAAAAYPDDITTLTGRGKAREHLKIFEKAKEDAQKVLKLNNNNKDGIMLLAKCELGLGNLEEALVMLNGGLNRRGKRREFLDGEKAIHGILENTIGKHAGAALADLEPTIRKMLAKNKKSKVDKPSNIKTNCLEELSQKPICHCTAEKFRRNEIIQEIYDEKLCKIHLGRLADDFKFFKLIANRASDITLKEIAEKGFKEINHQLELSKNRKPIYYMKNQPFFATILKEKRKTLEIKYDIITKEIDGMFRSLQRFREKHETKNCYYEAHKIKTALETFQNRYEIVKASYVEKLCHLMGFVYMDELKMCENLSFEENCQRIDHFLGFEPLYGDVWFDPTIKISAFPFFNTVDWKKTYKEFINRTENKLEKSWLHYEVGRCYFIQKKWKHLVVEGNKSANCARLSEHLIWRINALFQVVIAHCHLKNRDDALEVLQEARQCALQLQNEQLIHFLNQVNSILGSKTDEAFFVNVNKIIEKREKTIIRLQKDAITKKRAEYLLSRINFLPVDRRLGLVPGLIPIDDKVSKKK